MLWGDVFSIIASIGILIFVWLVGFLISMVVIKMFMFNNNFFLFIGRYILIVGYYVFVFLSIISCIIFFGIKISKTGIPHIGGVYFFSHPAIVYQAISFGLNKRLKIVA